MTNSPFSRIIKVDGETIRGYRGMTLNLELAPDVEAGLGALARARGLSVDDYLRTVLEQLATSYAASQMTPEQRAAAFEQWTESFPPTPVLADGAMLRDAIYRRDDGSPG